MRIHNRHLLQSHRQQQAALSLGAPEFAANPLLQDFHLGVCTGIDCTNNSIAR